ncbi:hypothetical protein RchiOBHm_Chr1g0343401 [Rosa chinensis]|uniref:Uncharacterized protein n=1 Tax=Rosa chinensis TaxID=74649 RepID=A0A2P6SEA4_ROSCH|nr:hypothetical protein RchiOBHm_Chr1g0343401 [Rosa chinensis]
MLGQLQHDLGIYINSKLQLTSNRHKISSYISIHALTIRAIAMPLHAFTTSKHAYNISHLIYIYMLE